ncbi:MAG TPA: autotransporter-associated beta strand repeat-containing protein [Opitutaceae bacterium]|nr:autotransporter-associated beta strand repeat-containing protein [Opitutaceae bacterium]
MRFLRLIAFAATAPWLAAATFVWNGGAGDGAFDNPKNWAGGVAPANDGSAVVVFGNTGAGPVKLSSSTNLAQIQFQNGSGRSYVFLSNNGSSPTITLQDGMVASGGGTALFNNSINLNVAQDQTFNLGSGAVEIDGPIRGTGTVTQQGAGDLKLIGSNLLWLGGISTASGTLTIGDSLSLGLGTLHLDGGTVALKRNSDIVVVNPIVISADTTLTGTTENFALFTGPVTLTHSVTLNATAAQGFVFTGPIQERGGSQQLTVTGFSRVVLTGISNYTGGTSVQNGALVFGTAVSVPKTGAITASPLGYVGAGFTDDLKSTLLDRLGGDKFTGIIGLDTLPGLSPREFGEQIDLTDLPNYHSLGSLTSAQISGVVKIAQGSDYRFGGGGGTIYLNSNLTARGNDLQLSSEVGRALTLVLRGNNTYKGDTSVLNSVLILDRANTLPQNSSLNLVGPGYVGMTENAGFSPNDFLSRINQIASPDAIAGIDSSNRGEARSVSSAIDLSLGGKRTDPYYLGTSSNVTLTGAITPTVGDSLYVTAVKNGHLTIASQLGSNIPGLFVGQTNQFDGAGGTVELTGSNSYQGGTQVRGGTLQVSNSNALGLGGVSVNGGANLDVSRNVTLTNPLSLASGARLSGVGTLASVGGVTIGNGAILSPGGADNIGRLTFNTTLTFASSGRLELEILKNGSTLSSDFVSAQGGLNLDASAASPFVISLITLGGSVPGTSINNFDLTKSFSWQFLGATSITGFNGDEFAFDTSQFLNGTSSGTFFMTQSGDSLMINFTPVPEPSTYLLFGAGALVVVLLELRSRKR